MKTVYYANFSCNNGTRYEKPVTDTNKGKLIKTIKAALKGEWFGGTSNGHCEVWHYDAQGREVTDFSGYIYGSGLIKETTNA